MHIPVSDMALLSGDIDPVQVRCAYTCKTCSPSVVRFFELDARDDWEPVELFVVRVLGEVYIHHRAHCPQCPQVGEFALMLPDYGQGHGFAPVH